MNNKEYLDTMIVCGKLDKPKADGMNNNALEYICNSHINIVRLLKLLLEMETDKSKVYVQLIKVYYVLKDLEENEVTTELTDVIIGNICNIIKDGLKYLDKDSCKTILHNTLYGLTYEDILDNKENLDAYFMNCRVLYIENKVKLNINNKTYMIGSTSINSKCIVIRDEKGTILKSADADIAVVVVYENERRLITHKDDNSSLIKTMMIRDDFKFLIRT